MRFIEAETTQRTRQILETDQVVTEACTGMPYV